MSNALLTTQDYVTSKKETGKNIYPTINRYDIMEAILSVDINDIERCKLSNMYSEILTMEKADLKYIDKIAVSSTFDSEIYEILKKWRSSEKCAVQ